MVVVDGGVGQSSEVQSINRLRSSVREKSIEGIVILAGRFRL